MRRLPWWEWIAIEGGGETIMGRRQRDSVSDTQRPSGVRHQVVALATVMAVLLYLDRFSLGFTEKYIQEELGLSRSQAGILGGAFFLTYALAQVPSGWLSDRYGPRRMLTAYILLWSLFTGLFGLASSFFLLLVFRLSCGLAQAGAYPTSATLVSRWASLRERGLASGIISSGGRAGFFLAPLLTAYLLIAFVPVTASSRLEAADLIDSGALCRALVPEVGPSQAPPSKGPAAALHMRLRSHLPADLEKKVVAAAVLDNAPLQPAQTVALAAALDEALAHEDLSKGLDLDKIELPPEARRLAAVPADKRTADEQHRLNRLLLEAAYPTAIRKIYGQGWRPVMVVYGLAGVIVAVLFWLGVRDWPERHPSCNNAELAWIAEGRPATLPPKARLDGIPWLPMLRSKGLWLSSITQFMSNFGWVFMGTLMPRYLEEMHRVSVVKRGWMVSLPVLTGLVGMVAGGWLTDWLTKRLGLRWGRGLPMALTRFGAMTAFLLLMVVGGPWEATLLLCLMAASTDLGTPALWAFNQDIGGRHVGSVLGWGNMWGNLGAAISPVVLLWLTGPNGRWDLCFLACAAAYFFAGIAALGIDSRIPILPPEKGPIVPATGIQVPSLPWQHPDGIKR
jgi:MFS family permease